MPTATGRLDVRGRFERPVLTSDGGGSTETTWETVATVWARSEPLTGFDLVIAEQHESGTTHRVIVRKPLPDGEVPNASWRWVEDGVPYELTAAPYDDRNEGRYWICEVAKSNE